MKLIAYISIFSILSSPFSFGESKVSVRILLEAIENKSIGKSPAGNQRKRGRAWNPVLEGTVKPHKPTPTKINNNSIPSNNGSTQLSESESEGLSNRRRSGAGNLTPPNLNSQANTRRENIPGRERPPSSGGGSHSENTLQDKSYWMPVCFLFDSIFDEAYARKTIKTVVDAYAACDIAIKVHSKTLQAGSYKPDSPEDQKAAAAYHCNAKEYYQSNDVKFQTAQVFPNSEKAADYMCKDNIEEKEKGNAPWTVGGCAEQPGEFSIVDRYQGGGTATHEIAHNMGRPGRGGDELENEGEGGVKTPAGLALQLKNSPVDRTKTPEQHDEGSHSGDGKFTPEGCASVRGGANDNSERKVKYNPEGLEGYYKRETEIAKQLVFQPSGRPFLPPKNTGDTSGPIVGNQIAGRLGTPRTSEGEITGSETPGHKKIPKLASNANRNRIGGGGQSSNPGNTQRGDGSPSEGGSAVTGGLGGPGEAKNTITVDTRAKELADAMNRSSSLDKNFFETSQAQGGNGDSLSSVSDRISASSSSESVRGGSSDFSGGTRGDESADKWQPDSDFFKYAKNNPGDNPSRRTIRTSDGTPSPNPSLRSLASTIEEPKSPNSISVERSGVQRGVKKGQVLFDSNL